MRIFEINGNLYDVTFNGNLLEKVRPMNEDETYKLGDLEEWTTEQRNKMNLFIESFMK